MIIFIITVVAVALMMIGLSITLMRKGHNIQGEVGENPDMQALGLSCALSEDGSEGCSAHGNCADGSTNGCADCADRTNDVNCTRYCS